MKRIGFGVEGEGKKIREKVKRWRGDVEGKDDIVEEVMRINGIKRIDKKKMKRKGEVNGRIMKKIKIRKRKERSMIE